MTSRILAVAVDCSSDQVSALEEVWCAAVGHRVARRWKDHEGVEYTELTGDGPTVLRQPVADADPALEWVVRAYPAGHEFCVLPPR